MRRAADDEMLALLAESNDLRRDVGRVLTAMHRALVLWRDRGKGLAAILRGWGHGACLLLDRSEARLRRLAPYRRDERLRRWVAPVLLEIAGHLEAGDARVVPLLRALESRFPQLTALMRDDARTVLHDLEAARDLRRAAAACVRTDRPFAVATLRDVARVLTAPPVAPTGRPSDPA